MMTRVVDYFMVGAVGILVGMVFSLPPASTVPYDNPQVVSIEDSIDGSVIVTVTFDKKFNECTFAALRVNGLVEGKYYTDLDWEDIDGDKGDRIAGQHTLRLRIYLIEGVEFVQVITRHYCGDRKVDLVLFEKNLLPVLGGSNGT